MVNLLAKFERRVNRLERPAKSNVTISGIPFRQWSIDFLPHYFTCEPSRFHDELTGDLDALHGRRGARLAYLSPRGAGKSIWTSQAYPIYCAVHGLERYIVLTADTSAQAEKYLDAIKWELTDNEKIAEAYPFAAGKGAVWRGDAIELRNGVRIEALGTGVKLRGRKHRQWRPSLIIGDDPQNTSHIISELKRSRSWEWWTKDVCNAGSPDTNIIALGTALHAEAILCRLFQTPGWTAKKFQSIPKWPKRMDLWNEWENILKDYDRPQRDEEARVFFENHPEMDDGDNVLWPERQSLYSLMTLRASIGPAAFLFEHQNEPTDPDSCEWPPSVFTHAAFWFDEWPAHLAVKTIALDPSKGSKDRDSDYSAYVFYGRDASGIEYVEADLDQRRDSEQMVADGIEHLVKFQPDGFGVEANAFQDLLAPMFRAEAKRINAEIPLHLLVNKTNKNVRIRRLTEPLVQRRIRFKRNSKGTALLVRQLQEFPNAGHDDGPDALEGARRLAIDLVNERAVRRR